MRTHRRFPQSLRLPFAATIEETVRSFTASGRALFMFFAGLMVLSTVGLLFLLNSSLLVAAPRSGGTLSEGVIGSPRFINPILAITDADRDLTALVFSGLLKATPEGTYVPDLASEYSVSEDGRAYTFVLRDHVTFHDGRPVTPEDIVFTIHKAQDPALKSPLRANWDGVGVEIVDSRTVRFTLKSAYAPFIENMTVGILPSHLWDSVSNEQFPFSELNATPVGSGPFKVASISRTAGGLPAAYTLTSFGNYALGAPYLSRLTLRFYQNEQALINALRGGDVEAGSSISPANISQLHQESVRTFSLNRVFGVFFNQNQSELLRDKDVRKALNDAIDRHDLVVNVLGGYGAALMGPIPGPLESSESDPSALAEAAKEQLIARGWKMNDRGILEKTTGTGQNAKTTTLSFDLSTGNVPELRAAAEYLRTRWAQMGAEVTIKIFEQGDLSQNVIRPRKYDALLFGQVIGRELDLFAFWHSSQRNDPGLNVALYANQAADRALESLRTTSDAEKRGSLYQDFLKEFERDIPAVFLYAPDFVYSVPNDIQGLSLGFIETPSDRFLSVHRWHRETDYVWPIFAR